MKLVTLAASTLVACVWMVAAPSSAPAQRTADEELASLRVPPGFDVSLFASEPMITNPAAIDIDTQGRVWVAEIQWYRAAAKDPPSDQIKVLEDTDGDGVADKSTVFAEGVFCPMSICVAGDKVYVATSPDLWVYEDKDGDLKADGPPTKLLTGFGGRNHDHGAHSLVLGPDHKWWMSHGDTGFNVTGVDGSHIEFRFGAMLRGELDGSRLETVAVNFRNPYEISVSSFGEAYVSDNDNDGNFSVRICWILEGGDYGWFGGPPFPKEELPLKAPPGTPYREHWHFRGHVPGYVPATLVTGFGSPCGMCFYEGDAFGPEYRLAPFHADAGPREVRIYRHEKAGYGMTATSENVITTDGDNYFRPDDVCTAPDGSLLVADWYDGGVGGHAYNDPTRGRIFRLTPTGKKLARVEKPGPYATVADAIEGLKSPNLATQFLARERLLVGDKDAFLALRNLLYVGAPEITARALWLLDRLDDRKNVLDALGSDDPALRALVIRILRRHGEQFADDILPFADDPSDEVRREVLLAIRGLNTPAAFDTLVRLAASYDGKDRYQLETINIAAGERKPQLYERLAGDGKWDLARLPLMQLLNPEAAAGYLTAALANVGGDPEAIRVLLEAAGNIPAPEAGKSLIKILANESAPVDLRRLALVRIAANLAGPWQSLAQDEDLSAAFRGLLAGGELQSDALEKVGELGLAQHAPRVRELAAASDVDPAVRQLAVRVAVRMRMEELASLARSLLTDPHQGVRETALDALVDVQDIRALRDILAAKALPAELQGRAVERLMQSTGGAIVLLRLIDDQALSDGLQQQAVRLAGNNPDSNVRVLYERFIPEDQRPVRLGSAIQPDEILAMQADAARGERIFFQSSAAQCKNCHRVHGWGATLGPDLSQIGKKYEIKTLLETILDPSKAIAPEYIPYLLETEGGQVFAGFLISKTDEQVLLRDAKGELIRIPAGEVADMAPQKKSLMPELVLKDVTAQDAADLLAYLATLKDPLANADRFRVLGPFDSGDSQGLDRDYGPEKSLASVDLGAEYPGLGGKTNRWDEYPAADAGGYLVLDQVKYCQRRGLPVEKVTCYFLVFADSAADQTATLFIGSDDSCKVWVNGEEVHRFQGSRAVGYGQDRPKASLRAGRNTIVIKVENYNGPGGVALSIAGAAAVELKTQ